MLTAIVLAKNEAENLPRCLKSLAWCDKVMVIDDNSVDDTVRIAREMGAAVLTHPLSDDYSAQRNWALSQAKSSWVLFVDADEVVSSKLAVEIRRALQRIECKGFLIPRLDHIWGKKLFHGDVGGVKLLRLARRGAGEWHGRVHETWTVEGRICALRYPIYHYPHPDMPDFLRRIDRYSTLRARELYEAHRRTNILEIIFYPLFKFKYLYFLKLGLLDGTPGFIHAMIMAFYTFLVRGKLWLLYKGIPK